jgi:PAS domain S-box-containing protein
LPYEYVSVRTEVTALKVAEQRARESEERYQRSQRYANIGTWDWNIQTGELYWSETIGPLFGYPPGELDTTYENFLKAVHPEDRDRVVGAVAECVERGAAYGIEHRCVWPDGTVRWMLERGDVMRAAGGTPLRMLGVVQDITDRKHAERQLAEREAELRRAYDEAERASRSKSEFLSHVSHELRTPLNAVLGYTDILGHAKDLPPNHAASVLAIRRAGQHLLELINELLDLARIEAGEVSLSIEAVHVETAVNECVSLVRPLAEQKCIAIDIECNGAVQIAADRLRLRQVLLNLLSNAIKFSSAGGRIVLACGQNSGRARLDVRDTGPGIAAADLHKLFKPFTRLPGASRGVEGTGIGLVITRLLVDLMQGEVGVSSEEGCGCTFWIELPLAPLARAIPSEIRLTAAENQAGLQAGSDWHEF